MTFPRRSPVSPALVSAAFVLMIVRHGAAATGYGQVNLVSDIPVLAPVTDANLVNPWGLASGPTSTIWVSDNGTGVATLYTGAGAAQSLVVTIPNGSPTGVVFNTTGGLDGATFLFATENGRIAAWKPTNGTTAVVEVDSSGSGAVYKGLALANSRIYATDFHNGKVDVFDDAFNPVISGTFVDPNLPAGFAPFGIQNIGGSLFVTYAEQDATGQDDVPGPGNGYLDEFDTDGVFLRRVVSGGVLNSPWGLALAPSSFGDLSGDLLVGNFGDGKINAFNPSTGAFIDTLNDGGGHPIVVEGLWGLLFGNGGNGGQPNELFFTAGIPGSGSLEDHGLFGKFAPILPDLAIAKSHSGDFAQGQAGAEYSIVVTNSGFAPTSGTVTVVDTPPAGLTATSLAGSGWSCTLGTLTCTRSDTLAAGASYPAIALTVDVASDAAATVTNSATVSGGGETDLANDTATDETTVTPPLPDLTIAKSHSGTFVSGQTGAIYELHVTNAGSAPTSGTITVTDTLPAGLTATAIAGAGWSCSLATLACTRSDPLGVGASYPPITITVDVGASAGSELTNTATVAGGGEVSTVNDTASDTTTVAAASVPTLHAPLLGLLGMLLAGAGFLSLRR